MPYPDARTVPVFCRGRSQAVRIPMEFELPGDEAMMHREGNRLVIKPIQWKSLASVLDSLAPLDEEFPEIGVYL